MINYYNMKLFRIAHTIDYYWLKSLETASLNQKLKKHLKKFTKFILIWNFNCGLWHPKKYFFTVLTKFSLLTTINVYS